MNRHSSLAFFTVVSALAASAVAGLEGCGGGGEVAGTGGHGTTSSTSSAAGSGGGGSGGGSGGGPASCVAEGPKLVTTTSMNGFSTIDVGAAGIAILTDGDTISNNALLTFANDGTPVANHALNKGWGEGVCVTEAGALALVAVDNAKGFQHYEAAFMNPTGELGAFSVVSPLSEKDELGTYDLDATDGQVVAVGDQFLVAWRNDALITDDALMARYVGHNGKPIGEAFVVIDRYLYHFAMTVDATGVSVLGTGGGKPALAHLDPGSSKPTVVELDEEALVSHPGLAGDGKGNLLLAIEKKGLNSVVLVSYQGSAGATNPLPYEVGPMGYLRGDRYALLLDTYPVSGRHLIVVDPKGTLESDSVIGDASASSLWETYIEGDTIRSVWTKENGEVWRQTDCAPTAAMP